MATSSRYPHAISLGRSPWLLIMVWGLLTHPAIAQEGTGSAAAVEWKILQAETELARDELQGAESHYREALLEGFFLAGLLNAAEGDLPAARDAFEQAANATGIGARRARIALAQIRLQTGETAEAANALRLLVQQDAGDVVAREHLVRALALAGNDEDARRELQWLRRLAPDAGNSLEQAMASGRRESLQLTLDLGELADVAVGDREPLRQRLRATLARVARNLSVLRAWGGRGSGEVPKADAEHAFGKVDLQVVTPPPSIKPQAIDPAALREAIWAGDVPESGMAVLRLLDDRRLDQAEDDLRTLLAADDNLQLRDLLGVVLSHRQRYDEAIQELEAVVASAPRSLSARQHLARAALLSGREDAGIEHLRQAAEIAPLERDLALALAGREVADGRLPAANKQLRSMSRRFSSTRATLELARIATELRNRKLALDFAARAKRFAPHSEEVLATHVRTALAARIPSTAAQSVEPLVTMQPDEAVYQYLLGQVWIALGNQGEAAEPLLRTVALDPHYRPAFLPLGLVLNHENRYDEAKPWLVRHLEDQPDDLGALAALAEAEERLGELEQAQQRADGVLAQDADHATANLVVGLLHVRTGDFTAARGAFEKAVARDSELTKAHYQLSLACARLGDRDAARHHLELYQKAQQGPEGSFETMATKSGPSTLQQKSDAVEREQ